MVENAFMSNREHSGVIILSYILCERCDVKDK